MLCPYTYCEFHHPMPADGLIHRPDGRSARVTSQKGKWGWWENGVYTPGFSTRYAAAEDFMNSAEEQHLERTRTMR